MPRLMPVVAIALTVALDATPSISAELSAPTVPLRVTGSVAVVDVFVNGSGPYPFQLDTGSSHTSISVSLAATLAAQRVARTLVSTPAGDAWAAVVRLAAVRLGPLEVSDLLATEMPGDQLQEPPIAGVIGRDLLGTRAFTVDYAAEQLRWPSSSALEEPGAAVLPLDTRGPVWVIRSDDAGRPLALVPDSGAEQTVLFDRGQWRQLERLRGMSSIRSVTNERLAMRGTLAVLNLGPVRFVEHPVIVVEGADIDRAHGDGLLPLHLFDRVTFRPRDGLVQLSRRGTRTADNAGAN